MSPCQDGTALKVTRVIQALSQPYGTEQKRAQFTRLAGAVHPYPRMHRAHCATVRNR